MKCPACAVEVYMTARHGLYDVDRYQHHFCGPLPLPEPEIVQWDRCDCGSVYGRINGGPRLDMRTWDPHVCQPVESEKPPIVPEPVVSGPTELPRPAAKLRLL